MLFFLSFRSVSFLKNISFVSGFGLGSKKNIVSFCFGIWIVLNFFIVVFFKGGPWCAQALVHNPKIFVIFKFLCITNKEVKNNLFVVQFDITETKKRN
jgi:hypothetical protein